MKLMLIAAAGIALTCLSVPPVVELHGEEALRTGQSERRLADLELEELMSIEVTTVRRRPERLLVSPSAVAAVTGETIRRSGVTNIPDALRLVPGMHVGRVDSHQWAVSARGFNDVFSNKLLVMIDGRSIYTPLFSGVFWDVHDTFLEDVERIEVIRGPGASLWGANAVNGVINVQTKDAADTQGTLLYGGGGNFERGFAGVRHGAPLGETAHLRVYMKHFDRGNLIRTDGSTANDSWRITRGGFRSDWRPAGDRHIHFQGDLYTGRVNTTINRMDPSPPHRSSPENLQGDRSGGFLLGSLTVAPTPGSEMIVRSYLDYHMRDTTGFFREERVTYDVDLQHGLEPVDRHRITWGAGYRVTSDTIRGSFDMEFDPGSRTDHLFTAFIQDEIDVVENRFTLTLGTKFEHNNYTGLEIQPGARAVLMPDERQAFWASVSRAVRTPSRAEHDVRINSPPPPGLPPGAVISFFGSDAFRSEELLAWEAGYRVQPGHRLSFDVAGFYNIYERLRSLEPLDPPFRMDPLPPHVGFETDNKISGETYGIEASGTWLPVETWYWNAGYSLLRMHLRRAGDSEDMMTVGQLEGGSPQHQFFLRSGVDLPGGWSMDATGRYIDSLSALGVGSYTALDLRLQWQPREDGLRVAIVGRNLLRRSHAEFEPSFLETQVTEVRRNGYVQFSWEF